MHNNKVVNIIGWIIAILSTALYTLTQYPTISFWDSAEFAAVSSTLQIPHPPGAPFFQILGTILPNFILSPLFSGLSVMMFYHICVYALSRFSQMRPGIIASSTIGALTFAVLDSQWFCANETDVYPLSLLLSPFDC